MKNEFLLSFFNNTIPTNNNFHYNNNKKQLETFLKQLHMPFSQKLYLLPKNNHRFTGIPKIPPPLS